MTNLRGRQLKPEHFKLPQTKTVASSEPYTHLIGLGDFAPEGATEISPGQAKRSPGFAVCSLGALEGRRSIEGQRPAPLRGASLRLCVTGVSAPLAPG